MTKITFVEHDGREHTVDAANDQSLMEAAMRHIVPGIDADCGGACACATCMVYVPDEWLDKLGEKDPMENTMLDFCEYVADNSRLSCQIKVTPALEGLRVTMPESQH